MNICDKCIKSDVCKHCKKDDSNFIDCIAFVPNSKRQGEWKVTPMSKIAYCSICDELIKDVPASIVTQFEFCPKCGSPMIAKAINKIQSVPQRH